jgi:hypothetical protein
MWRARALETYSQVLIQVIVNEITEFLELRSSVVDIPKLSS